MQLTPANQACLRTAFERLVQGMDRAFEDHLWLGFGDGWKPMLTLLERHGYVRIGGEDRETPVLTERGKELLGQLRAATEAATAK